MATNITNITQISTNSDRMHMNSVGRWVENWNTRWAQKRRYLKSNCYNVPYNSFDVAYKLDFSGCT